MKHAWAIALAVGLILSGACQSPTEPRLHNGILATFEVADESYSIFITNTETIDDVIALWNHDSLKKIPVGLVRKSAVRYNEPWSWHIDSEEIHMGELAAEVCDGKPSFVTDDWVWFCPWAAKLVSIKDYR